MWHSKNWCNLARDTEVGPAYGRIENATKSIGTRWQDEKFQEYRKDLFL